MHTGYRYVSSLFLTAALLAPPGIMAAFTPQDQERHEEHQREEQRRYYDREHRDGRDLDQPLRAKETRDLNSRVCRKRRRQQKLSPHAIENGKVID